MTSAVEAGSVALPDVALRSGASHDLGIWAAVPLSSWTRVVTFKSDGGAQQPRTLGSPIYHGAYLHRGRPSQVCRAHDAGYVGRASRMH